MEGYTVAFINSSFNFQTSFQAGFSPGVPNFSGAGQAGQAFGARPAINPQQFQQLFFSLMSAMQQLAQGYQGFGGQPFGGQQGFPGQFQGFPTMQPPQGYGQPFGGYGQNPFQFYPSPGTPSFPTYPSQPFPGQPQPQPIPGSPGTPGNPVAVGPGFNKDFNWQGLDPTTQQGRDARGQVSGLNDTGRAAMHLWGIQVTSAGKNNGGIYFNVLQHPENFKPAEVALVKDLYNKEMSMYGGVTGKLLDQQFFGVYKQQTGEDLSTRYGNRPIEFAQGPVDMNNRLTGNNGLSAMDNTVIRMWGHDSLDNGAIDGSITEFTLLSQNALDKTDGSTGSLDKTNVQRLLAADLADGVRDGSSMKSAFIDSLDRIYFGGPGASSQSVLGKAGLNDASAANIIKQWEKNPPPGIPAGVDITNLANIGKCPVLGQSVAGQQPGLAGAGFL